MSVQRAGATLTLVVACAGVLLAQVDTSIVNLILHRLHEAFGASNGQLRWFVDGYNVAYAAAILSAGALGDRLGRRKLFAIGIAVFTAGSAACALAPNPAFLIAARVLTGIGAALEVPATLALLSIAFPEGAARGRALGVWASMNGLAFAIGPVAGGVLADAFGWRSVFAVAIPFGIASLVLAQRLCEPPARAGTHLDVAGQTLAAFALGTLTFGAMAAGSRAYVAAAIWILASIAGAAAFVSRERRTREPLVDLAVFGDARFVAATFATGCMTFGMYGMLFLTPLALQTFRGMSTTQAGVALLPLSLVFVAVSTASGAIAARIGKRATIVCGMIAMGAGCAGLAAVPSVPWPSLAPSLAATGVGLGLTTGQLLGYAVSRAHKESAGAASGIGNAARMFGATLGVAILGATFAGVTAAHATPLRLGYGGAAAIELLGALVSLAWIR